MLFCPVNSYEILYFCVKASPRRGCTGLEESTPRCSGWWQLCLVRISMLIFQWEEVCYVTITCTTFLLKNQCFCFGCSLSTVLQHPQPQLTYTWMQMPGTTRPSLVASKIILGNIKHIVIFNRTSELWSYMISTVHRCLAEPVLTYRLHKEFIKAASKNPYCLFLTEMQSVDYWGSCKQVCQCF